MTQENSVPMLTLYRGGAYRTYISLRADSPCITAIIANAINPESILFLVPGEHIEEEDFLEHDILQEATYPSIHSLKYHQSFLINRLIIASKLLFLCLICVFKQVAKSRQ